MGGLTCAELTLGSHCLFSHNHNLMKPNTSGCQNHYRFGVAVGLNVPSRKKPTASQRGSSSKGPGSSQLKGLQET